VQATAAIPWIRLLVLVLAVGGSRAGGDEPVSWELRDGDRVVLLGDTFIERDGQRGFIEAALVAAHPEASLTFRNLGWSGDTVWADSRGVFDPPAKGYERMLGLVQEQAPTVVVIAYGRNESERGAAGLEAFRQQLKKLCIDVRAAAAGTAGPAAVRLVLVTPYPFETIDAETRNAALAEYVAAIREVAAAEQAGIVDLFAVFPPASPAAHRLTKNGLHLSDAGYAAVAEKFVASCGRPPVAAETLARLRPLVVAKNELFFHRWRPANETYIFLFRKHEQGNNAVEMPRFDPLVTAAEDRVRAAVTGSH
jgi:lysophospholipase L1-like esterase